MEDNLISKKDLLDLTGISYGQLYRWKRKNLIPESWFIRKATFTGQETFFPKDAILARIDKIISMKEDLSLNQLADMFSPVPSEVTLTRQSLVERNIVSDISINLYNEFDSITDPLGFYDMLTIYLLEKLLQTGEISLEEGRALIRTFKESEEPAHEQSGELIVTRKMGVSFLIITSQSNYIRFEHDVKIAVRVSITRSIEELKSHIVNGGTSHEQ